MADAAMRVDPEMVAAQQLLQKNGYVVPDRTKADLAEVRAAQSCRGARLAHGRALFMFALLVVRG